MAFGDFLYAVGSLGQFYHCTYDNPATTQVEEEEEGTVYESDPLTNLLAYLPMLAGVILLLAWLVGMVSWPWLIAAAASTAFGFSVFVLCTEQIEPETLGIWQFLGSQVFFRNCRVFIIRPILGMTLYKIAGFRTIDIAAGETMELKAHMRVPADSSVQGSQQSLVEVVFTGSFLIAVDINRPLTVMRMFYDDLVAHPRRPSQSVLDEWGERCRRIIAPAIFGACDPILQTFEWTVAAGNIGALNSALLNQLPLYVSRLGVIIEQVILSSADGPSFQQLQRQAAARLEAETAIQQAQAEQARRTATAEAEAIAKEREEAGRQRQGVATALANREIGLAEQTTAGDIAAARLGILPNLAKVATKEASIAVAPFIAQLRAIKTGQSAAPLNAFLQLTEEQKAQVLVQLATSQEASGTYVNVGGNPMDIFSQPAVLGRFAQIMQQFGFTAPTTPPTGTP